MGRGVITRPTTLRSQNPDDALLQMATTTAARRCQRRELKRYPNAPTSCVEQKPQIEENCRESNYNAASHGSLRRAAA